MSEMRNSMRSVSDESIDELIEDILTPALRPVRPCVVESNGETHTTNLYAQNSSIISSIIFKTFGFQNSSMIIDHMKLLTACMNQSDLRDFVHFFDRCVL